MIKRDGVRWLSVLVLLIVVLSGCSVFRRSEKPEVDLTEIFPDDLPTVGQVRRLDVDRNGKSEWLVFYHIDLVENDVEGSPTTAAVYRPLFASDKRLPPYLVPELLWVPRWGYLCAHDCEAKMEDVLGGEPNGKELVIRDERDDDTVGVTIFRWQTWGPEGADIGLVPLGHFRGDAIEVEKDRVTVVRRYRDRSNLAVEEIYEPREGRYYAQEVPSGDDGPAERLSPEEAKIVFWPDPPKEPVDVKQPEKLVLAFYQHWDDLDEIESYLAPVTREVLEQGCPANVCGCASDHRDVERVMVKQIAYEADLDGTQTSVVTQVVCVDKGGDPEPMGVVTWTLNKREDKTWRLRQVVRGGQEYLCPRFECTTLGSR